MSLGQFILSVGRESRSMAVTECFWGLLDRKVGLDKRMPSEYLALKLFGLKNSC
ncbi:hypothetical protein VCHA50O407_120014 [Vibrio chagasii]|nr:hypothetical protein VCHA34P115_110151 [Vibrio chagasii]CAH6835946.1 hypothetical protein VCHA36O157_10150 [Vibrio chagasii]CAH6847672.1 hypothetical protein VCHA34P131_10621 [Vibrio chagasii]CAH6934420.1 hypothetical protein VCHA50O407_120014 [Vibrio chagasii]CAH6997413.1 hypothetical protein VCHA34P121_50134 [Vibrio chagasii]